MLQNIKISPLGQNTYYHTTTLVQPNWVDELQSQPFYHFGALVREGFDSIFNMAKRGLYHLLSALTDLEQLKLYNAAVLEDEGTLQQLAQRHPHYRHQIKKIIDEIEAKDAVFFQMRKQLSDHLKAALKRATKSNKPLMIIIGEDHESSSAALGNIIAILTANDISPIATIHTETFDYRNYDEKVKRKVLQQFFEERGVTLKSIDLAQCWNMDFPEVSCQQTEYPQVGNAVSEEGISIRNTVMADVLSMSEEKVIIGIVGASHLIGLLHETALTDHFEVFPINTAKQYYVMMPDPNDAFIRSNSVFQFNMQELMPATIHTRYLIAYKVARLQHKSSTVEKQSFVSENVPRKDSLVSA